MANVVGPGAVKQNDIAPSAALDGASEYEYVTIHNPLTDDFQVMVAQDVPINMPFEIKSKTTLVQSERDVTSNYGLQLKNPDHKAKKFIYNSTIIPAGGTMNFKGNEAQVVVRQLINEILQRSGKKRLMADPHLRSEIESQVIVKRGSVQELLDGQGIQTPRQQIDESLNKSNEGIYEQEATGLGQADASQAGGVSNTPDGNTASPAKLGRPKKANS